MLDKKLHYDVNNSRIDPLFVYVIILAGARLVWDQALWATEVVSNECVQR